MSRSYLSNSFATSRHQHHFVLGAIFQGGGWGNKGIDVILGSLNEWHGK